MAPGAADRLVNWLRHKTTNSSITVPKRYASQVPWPALEKASGMMRTAVIVGDIRATDWASSAGNPSAPVLSPVFTGASLTGATAICRPFLRGNKGSDSAPLFNCLGRKYWGQWVGC